MTGRLTAELDTFLAQSGAFADRLASLPEAAFATPTLLAGWDLRTLTGHVLLIQQGLARVLATRSTATPIPSAQYVRAYRRDVELIAARTAETTADRRPRELVAALRDVAQVRLAADGVTDKTVLDAPRGAITALDWVITRTVDLVVHCDDLNRTITDGEPVALLRPALAATTRSLAEMLAAQAPGRSVEVRIPPFVAVQAVPGPRHTRGTPPNVVETDALTWLRLATGRVGFADEIGRAGVNATGPRSDLSEYLPLFS